MSLHQPHLTTSPHPFPSFPSSSSSSSFSSSQISEAVLQGHIKVLYVSPERLCTPSFRRLITLLKQQQRFRQMQSRQTRMYNSEG